MILQRIFKIRRRGSRRSYREKDTSSSSSSDDVDRRDEASFTKRKEKRMKIERSKLLPLNMDKTDDLALWCAYLTAFYGLLRKSSTVPERQMDPNSKSLLRRNIRVDKNNNMVYLYLGYSKNNNFCTRDVIIPIPGNSNLALDLVRHLKKLFSVVDTPMDSPAFSFSKKQGVT